MNFDASNSTAANNTEHTNFWKASQNINPGAQMQELMSMIQTMMMDIVTLKENQLKKN